MSIVLLLSRAVFAGDPGAVPAESAPGRLARGIALFEDGQFARAHSEIKQALGIGLADGRDQALAHKYLAFYYCLHGVPRQCVKSFERALLADAEMRLAAEESANADWRAAFENARRNIEKTRLSDGAEGMRISADKDARAKLRPRGDSAVLVFDIMPWGALYIDGKLRAVTPPDKQIRLPSGSHDIKIVNGHKNPVSARYRLAGGEVYVVEYTFE